MLNSSSPFRAPRGSQTTGIIRKRRLALTRGTQGRLNPARGLTREELPQHPEKSSSRRPSKNRGKRIGKRERKHSVYIKIYLTKTRPSPGEVIERAGKQGM